MLNFKGSFKKNYGGRYYYKNKVLFCYTKNQIKNLYPNKDYKVVGEYSPKKTQDYIGKLHYIDDNLCISEYKTNNRLIYSEKGFVSVEGAEDSYIVLLKRMIPLRLAGLFLCILLISGCVFCAVNRDKLLHSFLSANITMSEPNFEEGATEWQGVQVDDKNKGGIKQGISIPGYKSITLDAETKDVKVNLLNPKGNPCYFEISLILEDGTLLYKSKKIKPGMGLYNIKLNRPLPVGQYNATLKYDTFSLTDLSPLNGANVKVELIAS